MWRPTPAPKTSFPSQFWRIFLFLKGKFCYRLFPLQKTASPFGDFAPPEKQITMAEFF
jgi:hypothetical protein